MPKENEIVTVSVLREMLAENNAILMKRMDKMDEKFDGMDARFDRMDTEFARVHREIGNLRDDVVDVIDRSIVPQLEEHRRDISLLKRAVTMA